MNSNHLGDRPLARTRPTLGMLLILALVIGSTLVQDSRAASVNIRVDSTSVSMTMTLELLENLTSLPQRHIMLDVSNSTLIKQIEQPIDNAIKKLVPSARIQDITLQAKTGNVSSQMFVLQENYTVLINGANANAGGLFDINLGFLSMSDLSPMFLNGTELNNVGAAYLLQPLESFPTATTNKYRFYLNGKTFLNSVIPASSTQTFSLLDFSWVPQISQWSNQYQPLDPSSRWDYRATPYNLTVGLISPEGALYRPVVAYYQSSLDLVAPSRAWAQETHLYFSISTTTDYAMPLIISAILVTGVGSFILDRTLTGRMRRGRRSDETRKKKR